MPWTRPTLDELIDRTKADFESRLTNGGSLLRRATARVLSRVHAGAMHLLYGFASFIARQIMPDTAEAEFLRRWASIWDVNINLATFAKFTVTFTGDDGITIPILTEIVRSDGRVYTTDLAVTTAGGIGATAAVTAKDSGSDPNVEGGELLSLSSPIVGIDSQAEVSSVGIVDGTDIESDPALLVRLLNRIQTPPNGGSENDYVTWAKEVAGVTRAWCYPNYYGTGSVGVTFVRDNDISIIPSGGEVTAVQDYITDPSRAPVTADVTVFAPVAAPLAFTISGVSNTTVRAAIQAELADLILREAEPGGTLLLTHINEAISKAQGEVDHVLSIPAANVTSTAGHLITMGTITWL